MSQFGTIGTPRFHPCMAHPSCSQFNANDIIHRSAREEAQLKQVSFLPEPQKLDNIETDDLLSPPKSIKQQMRLAEEPMRSDSLARAVADEENRRYIEVSPGVWSYAD